MSYHFEEFDSYKIRKGKILVGVLPSFIHSIDAALMRLIIIDVFNSSKYIINHLHDSIQYNPKYYNNVMKSINNVYCNSDIQNSLENNFLIHLRQRLFKEKRIKFDSLINDLRSHNYKEIEINENKFEAENMFPHE